jgi:N6-L-threonylcarbamoyladenine synthase
MLVLAIESSCDETGAAVVQDGRFILSNVVASQIEIHNRYGGVVPEVASRQQLAAIIPVVETALEGANCSWEDIDAVAATYGPGLAGSLLVGLTVGKTLALARNLPFLGINHLEAHIYANWLRGERMREGEASALLASEQVEQDWRYLPGDPVFPLLSLVVSGAHSELVLVRDHGDYELLGRTRDDAAGEAFDKVARVLGLGYPGGPAIQKMAQQAEELLGSGEEVVKQAKKAYQLPRAWLRDSYDFSFSGVKTAMLHLAEGAAGQSLEVVGAGKEGSNQQSRYTRMGEQASQQGSLNMPLLAASFQEAIVDVLATKTRRAAQEFGVRQVVLAGGVAANGALRARIAQELQLLGVRLSYPRIEFCTDNAAMIGSAAFFHLSVGERNDLTLDVQPGLSLPFRK